MATRANRPEPRRPKSSNPIAHVSYERRDLFGAPPPAGGGGKELVPVTQELRRTLAISARSAAAIIAAEAIYPDIPGVMVIRLRDAAIAKSHRPLTLISEANMLQAGHGEINEMLVAVDSISIAQLEHVINARTTKAIKNNLSAVDGFEAWDTKRRLPKKVQELALPQVLEIFRQVGRRLMIRLFSHDSAATTSAITARFEQLILDLGLNVSRLTQRAGPPLFFLEMNDSMTVGIFTLILQFQGVRHARPEPRILPTSSTMTATVAPAFTGIAPTSELPIVAVFDSGIDPSCVVLQPWVASRDAYILPPDTNYVHGTAVGSLVIDSHGLNNGHPHFPMAHCLIHDVCALESGANGSPQGDLIIRLREAIQKAPHVKVWNLSLGGAEIGDDEFSEFGRELDALSDAYGVLFIVAAGNYKGMPRRGWPILSGTILADRISSPADSVRALTIGAITHLDGPSSLVHIDEPASYSRCGPGPVFTPKPDIVHVGGNADVNFQTIGIGVNVLNATGTIYTGCGTSFASPVAAALAAQAWQTLSTPGRANDLAVSPVMVKALLIHSAQLNSPDRSSFERRYYGAGLPGDPVAVLYDSDSSFTVLFELDMVDTMKWRKTPFPIPPSLIHDGKLKAEVIITAVYAPPLDPSKGAEYVRFNVDVGFGRLTYNANGSPSFHGCVPVEGEFGTTGFEKAQVEHGGKWSPVKTYRRSFSKGTANGTWALQATLLRRALEPQLKQPLRVIIAVTLRALDDNPHVYQEGRRLLAATNWISQDIASRVDIPVHA